MKIRSSIFGSIFIDGVSRSLTYIQTRLVSGNTHCAVDTRKFPVYYCRCCMGTNA